MADPALTPEVLEELTKAYEAYFGELRSNPINLNDLHVAERRVTEATRTHLPALLVAAQRVQELEKELRAHVAELAAIDDALGPLTEATRQAQVRGLVEELRAVYQLAGSPRTVFMGEPFLRVEVTWQAGWGRSLQEAARYYAGIGSARQAEKETTT